MVFNSTLLALCFHKFFQHFLTLFDFLFPRNVNPVIWKCEYGFHQITHASKVSPSHSSSTRDLERLYWHSWFGKTHTRTSSSQDWPIANKWYYNAIYRLIIANAISAFSKGAQTILQFKVQTEVLSMKYLKCSWNRNGN